MIHMWWYDTRIVGPYNQYDWYIAAPLIGLSTLVSLWNKVSWNFILNPLLKKSVFLLVNFPFWKEWRIHLEYFTLCWFQQYFTDRYVYFILNCQSQKAMKREPIWDWLALIEINIGLDFCRILGQNDFWILGQNYKVQGFSDNVLTQYVASAWN